MTKEPSERVDSNLALPKVGDLLDSIGADVPQSDSDRRQSLFEQEYHKSRIERESEYIKLKALQDHFVLKNEWSGFIKKTLVYLIGFQSVLLVFVGWGWFDFKDYQWLLPSLMLQTMAHVVALAVIVVKSLFDKSD